MLVPNPSRKTTTRARTGCTTCKARHVKCDETKPGCLRCIKFWGVCEGYGPDSSKTKKRKGSSGHGVVVPRMAPIRFVLAKYPTNAISKSETEDRYFQFFCNQTASTLSGYFKSELWNRLILQMGPREEFVRHAIIAIAALDKTMEVARKVAGISAGVKALPTTSVSDANTHHQMALKHYGKALKLMRMADPNDAHYLRNTLIGCLVTSCFESFHGNQESALIQTQAGINILFGFRDPLRITKRQRLNRTLTVDVEIEDELIDMFNRLDFQILTFRDRRTVDQHDLVFQEAMDFLSEMPAAFRDLAEARMYLDVAGNATMHWRARVAFTNPPLTTFSFQTTNDANYNIPPSSILTADQLKAGHAALFKMALGIHDAFVPVFQASRVKRADGSYPPEYAGATVMMLVMIIGRFSIPSDQSDLMYDQFLPDFKYVLSLCKEILEYEGRSAKPVFHFDIVGVVTALFMTATRCRDRIVRRQAVILLQKYPRREGLWDSAMACTLAAWFIDAEEHGLEGDFVPEERRLRVVSNDFDLSKRRALVKCSKKAPDSQERVMMANVLLTW